MPAGAQQGAPPPAVLVQPAELKPIADQAEFIGRAAAVDKVELRARVKGFLGPRKFTDGDLVKEGQVLFTIEPEPYQAAVDQKVAQRDAAKAALTNADLQLKRAAELLRTNTGTQATYDQRLSEQLQAKAQLEDAERPAARRRDPALLHRDQVADRRPHRPRRGLAGQHRRPRLGRAGHRGQREPDPRAVLRHPARAARGAARRGRIGRSASSCGCGWPTAASTRKRARSTSSTSRSIAKTDGQIVRAVFDNKDGLLTDGQTVRVIVEGEQAADRGGRAAGRDRP